MGKWVRIKFYKILARYKSRAAYPDSMDFELFDVLNVTKGIRVAIIDDVAFPWVAALESKGCKVKQFGDYTKPLVQSNHKIKTYDFSSYDIIICDIHGVGAQIYPDSEGISVITNLRQRYPLHVICAYTASPGDIYRKINNQDCLDKVFSRDWSVEDFLLNFQVVKDIFSKPRTRWGFIAKRLRFLEVPDRNIDEYRRAFMQHAIFLRLMKSNKRLTTLEIVQVLRSAPTGMSIDYGLMARLGISAGQLTKFIGPLFHE